MELRVGTAGYSYPAWVGPFYPTGTGSAGMLSFYARHLSVVEINSSFHRPPTPAQVEKMAGRTPPGFGFTLKVPQSVSHSHDPADLPAFRAAADRLHALGRLLGLLVQVPESYHRTPAHRDWLRTVADALRPHSVTVEFRHRSWDTPDLNEWATAAGLGVVGVGVPAIASLFPAGPRVVNRRVYARLHSQNAEKWYKGGPNRYDYDYPDAVIRKWAGALKAIADAGRADSGLVFFNNCACVAARAVENARQLVAVLKDIAPSVRVIDPPAPARQATLFGDE